MMFLFFHVSVSVSIGKNRAHVMTKKKKNSSNLITFLHICNLIPNIDELCSVK